MNWTGGEFKMKPLDLGICSASDCDFKVTLQHGCVDEQGRKYCWPACAYLTLERERVEDPIEHVNSLRQYKNL